MSNMRISALRLMVTAVAIIRTTTAGRIEDASSNNSTDSASGWTTIDSAGQKVEIPAGVDRVICLSGGTCIGCLVYTDVADRMAALCRGYIGPGSPLRLKLAQNYTGTFYQQ